MGITRHRDRRFTALVHGSMAEMALAGVLLVWLNHPDSVARAAFGAVGSTAALVSGMVMTAVAMAVLLLGNRLRRTVVITTVAITSLVLAGVGVLAIATLATDPGLTVLLALGWIFAILLTLAVTRAGAQPPPPLNRKQR
jgi:hypothetical protein